MPAAASLRKVNMSEVFYNPADHYWLVGDRIWSSALPGYVAAEDAIYAAWVDAGSWPTRIASEEELDEVLLAAGHGDRSPNPPKRTVLKSVIISRLIAAEKIEAARAALDQDAAAYARWWAPDRPAINCDDPDALALLAAIGADPDVILGP
jgi:hypothetical protein